MLSRITHIQTLCLRLTPDELCRLNRSLLIDIGRQHCEASIRELASNLPPESLSGAGYHCNLRAHLVEL